MLAEFLSSYRIRSLTTHGPHIYLILPDLPQRSVADLEQLVVYYKFYIAPAPPIDLNDIRYPKLAVIRGTKVSCCSSLLRVFDGGVAMTIIESWDLLSRCPSLEKGRFVLKYDCSPAPVSVPRIHLQHLETLTLEPERTQSGRVDGVMPFSTFIEALALPNVEDLFVTHRVAWSATAFQLFSQRSNHFPNLRHFFLKSATSEVDAGALIASMPSIRRISVCAYYQSCYPQAFFNHFALNGLASGSLAPRLQSLSAGYVSNVGEFMAMVESRMKNAQMSSDGVLAPFTFVQFRERGLDLESDQLHWGVRIVRDK